nr:MAG TPA: dUTPase [Caudoviricetes sp.]
MKIKIKEVAPGCMPEIIKVGDCIDLMTSEEYTLKCPIIKQSVLHRNNKVIVKTNNVEFNYALLDLGVVIELPKGFEAILLPRSSTFKKWGILQTNSIGEIDQSFCGPNDIWKMPVLATRSITIPKGTPIAQFKIQLSQKATIWQKLRWLFSPKIELVKVDELHNEDRGGLGTGSDKYRNNNN